MISIKSLGNIYLRKCSNVDVNIVVMIIITTIIIIIHEHKIYTLLKIEDKLFREFEAYALI